MKTNKDKVESAQFILTTDTSCDVFRNELNDKNIAWAPLHYTIDGEVYDDNFSSDSEYENFYAKIEGGLMPTTSQINSFAHEEFFRKVLNGKSGTIVHLTLSSGLSSTVSSAKIAATTIESEIAGSKVYIIDTLSATQGHHYILDEAVQMRDSGISAEQAVKNLNDLAKRIHHWVMVDDLMHLRRGGRVSGAAAAVGTLLKIKPILIINDKGKLVVVKKIKGLAKSYEHFVSMALQHVLDKSSPTFYIAYANVADRANELESLLKQAFPCCKIKKGWIGPVIGSHTGSGTLGLVYESDKRLN